MRVIQNKVSPFVCYSNLGDGYRLDFTFSIVFLHVLNTQIYLHTDSCESHQGFSDMILFRNTFLVQNIHTHTHTHIRWFHLIFNQFLTKYNHSIIIIMRLSFYSKWFLYLIVTLQFYMYVPMFKIKYTQNSSSLVYVPFVWGFFV